MKWFQARFYPALLLGVCIALLVHPGQIGAEEEEVQRCRRLLPGVTYTQKIEISPEGGNYVTNCFRIPAHVLGVSVSISNAPVDLDLFLKHEHVITDYHDVDFSSTAPDFNEHLFLSRFSDQPFQPGLYYLDVAYQHNDIPKLEGKEVDTVAFSIEISFLYDTVADTLVADKALHYTLVPEGGMLKTVAIDVPVETSVLRVDLFDTNNDLDIIVNYGRTAHSRDKADHVAESFLSREHILITPSTGEQYLRPGRYFITVIDQVADNRPAAFGVIARFLESPPEMLLDTPAIPEPRNDLERALLSTVEISGEAGTGSGCLVSPTGLILTNYHVIRNNSGEPSRKLTVAVNLGFRVPPKELFRAEVIDYHEETDLALLRITGGFYEQELPEGYTFPFLELGDPQELAIGDQIGLVGFPGIGGSGSRASVTFTRGVISGYEQTDCGVVIKTDGQVSPGNSGGPAIDGDYTLIGLPTTIIEENAGLMGFIHPISLLPDEWISIIREAQ